MEIIVQRKPLINIFIYEINNRYIYIKKKNKIKKKQNHKKGIKYTWQHVLKALGKQ